MPQSARVRSQKKSVSSARAGKRDGAENLIGSARWDTHPICRALRDSLNFKIPPAAWSDWTNVGEAEAAPTTGSRLYASLRINGIGFHCEALEVRQRRDGALRAADPYFEKRFVQYCEACGAAVVQPMIIHGRSYAVFLTPFG